MRKPKILLKKKINFNEVFIVEESSNRRADPLLDKKAMVIWQERLIEAEKNNQRAWDSVTYRLNSFNFKKGKFLLNCGLMNFSLRNTLKSMPELDSYSEDYLPKGLAIGGFIETTDNYFIFGIRSGKTLGGKGDVDFIGGILSKDEKVVENGEDLKTVLFSEIVEEIGIGRENILTSFILGLISSESGNVIILAYSTTNLSKQQVLESFKDMGDEEMANLIFVKKDKLEDFLKSLSNYRCKAVEFLKLIRN